MLKIENLTKKYSSHTVLDDISMHIPRGGIFGLLGPNGAGKTSLIRIINQITAPDKGRVLINDEELQPRHSSLVGYLPEERGLYKNMKVSDQVLFFARLKGLSNKKAKDRLDYWLSRFDISDWGNKKVSELSKGMAQKIQFIITVIHEPSLLIFDEPFSGFDPINAQLIRDEILNLKKTGATIIFSTHRMESVEEICDHIALINRSKKILDGNLLDIKSQFKENEFHIHIQPHDDAQKERVSNYDFVKECFLEKTYLSITIKLGQHNINETIQKIISHGNLIKFEEKIPSINDIFIKMISNTNSNMPNE